MPVEVIREIVGELRQRRLQGASAAELVHFIESLGLDEHDAGRYMTEAFCLKRTPNMRLLMRDGSYRILDSALNGAFERVIDEARDTWTAAGPYPDLIRRRDRHVFKEVARAWELIIFVGAASPSVEHYVGKPGYSPRPPWLVGIERTSEPNAGLIAADPEDTGMIRELKGDGFTVGSRSEGYIVRDGMGRAFYPGYALHAVYSANSGLNAWTVEDGEKIRAALNRGLGEELVQCGPLAIQDQGRGAAPRFPLLMFHAEGAAYVIWEAGGLAAEYNFRKIAAMAGPG